MEAYAIDDWDELEASYFGTVTGTDFYTSAAPYGSRSMDGTGYAYGAAPAEVPYVAIPQKRPARERAQEQKARIEENKKIRHQERNLTFKRFREMVLAISCIAVVAGMFTFILVRQSEITSLNYKNHETEVAINKTLQETKQIKEGLVAQTNLDQVRSDAMEKIGMQDPSARQVVSVVIPGSDQLVTNDFSSSEINSKVSLASAKENLAQYYSSLG
jgi:cell division protein FtsL